MLSVAIMAHPKREKFVESLARELPQATVVWDEANDRWDTGRRALLVADHAADWHVVVQDDAILCSNFLAGVEAALAGVPVGYPVSFYTGKTRPYGEWIANQVAQAVASGKSWIAMRGPLWGVALALPTARIAGMIEDCDSRNIPNYDVRMAGWFGEQNIACWYSIPSLVNHRVGPENPSLVHERGNSSKRTAHLFADELGMDPLDVNWDTGAYWPGDPTMLWTEDNQCVRCLKKHDSLRDVIMHQWAEHDLGPVDFLASTPYHRDDLQKLADSLPSAMVGEFYYEPDKIKRMDLNGLLLRKPERYMIVGAARDLKYTGGRRGWSVVGAETN